MNIIKSSILLLIIYYCFSCSSNVKTPIEIMEDSIKVYFLNNLDDPNSYEPIKTEIMDTIYYTQNIQWWIDDMNKYAEGTDPVYGKEDKAMWLRKVKFYKDQLDSILASREPKAVAAYRALHTFRAKNKFGALVKEQVKFEFKPNLKLFAVRSMSEPKGTPGGIPRYAPQE